jgi:hypothetical protein
MRLPVSDEINLLLACYAVDLKLKLSDILSENIESKNSMIFAFHITLINPKANNMKQ